MSFRVVDAVPTRGEGDWAGACLVDRVAAMGLVSCMYVYVCGDIGFEGLFVSQICMILSVDMQGNSQSPSETM